MKKRFVILAIVALALLLTIAYFIPSYDQKEIKILSPIMRTALELNSPAEWQRWNPIIKKYCAENPKACALADSRPKTDFTLQASNYSLSVAARGVSFDIAQTGDAQAAYNYTLVSSLHNDSTTLIVTAKTNLLSSFFSSGLSDALAYGDSLKSFIENPSAYYGFAIRLSPVIDSNVVTTHKTVVGKNTAATLKYLYKVLDSFIQASHLKVVQPKIAHFQPKGNDSVDVMVGVPIEHIPLKYEAKNGISFMKMPVQGRIVIAHFKGKYGDKKNLYQSMDRYLNDKLLKAAAANYEEYLDNNIPENDSSQVEMNLCAPCL